MTLTKYKLNEIAEICNGATPSTSDPENYDGEIVWITPKDLSTQQNKYIKKGERNISQKGYDNCSTHMIPAYNILMSSRAPIGLLSINTVDCCTNQGFKNLIVDKSKADVDYLYYYLKVHIKEIEALGSGTTFKEVSKVALEKFDIDLPSLEEQKRISSVLSNLDSKISLNRSINLELEQMAKEIYDYWFVQFEFPDANGRPYKSSGGAMVYNPVLKREVPEGWEVKRLSQLGSFRNGINYSKDEIGNKDYRIANVRNVSSSTLFLNTLDLDVINLKQELADKYLVKPNDILITRSGCPGATRISQGKSDFSIIFCGFIICFTVEDIDFKHFLTYQLKQLEDVTKGQSGGSILSNISQDVLKNLCVVIPPKSIVKTFNYNISKIWNLIDTTIEQSNEIKNLRDELLPLLMTGQVKIK